ncbi:MAG: CoA transferase [Dehalococcoidales bacterium]|nr:CoA transferase [Dehalococcoidales bacterium]
MGNLLSGIRVIALEQILAGPFGSMLLADFGAEVIKIEPPDGEIARRQTGPRYNGEPSYYLASNRNKKSIVLDLRTPSGKEALHDLVKISDVVWDNHRAGVMDRLEAGYDTLKKINPRIICCNITGYGTSGPFKDLPSYDGLAQAMSGILSLTGEEGGPPIKPGPSIADLSAGLFSALGVCAALVSRNSTGVGQRIEVSLLDAAVALLGFQFSSYFISGKLAKPVGSGHINTVPTGAYKARDGWIAIGASWPRITRVLNIEWMQNDPRFSTGDSRLLHRKEIDKIIGDEVIRFDVADLIELLRAEDISCSPVDTLDKVAVNPQIVHNNMILTLAHPLGGEIKLVGQPVKAPESIKENEFTAPPTLGQHTNEILTGLLHYSKEKIERLEKEGKEHYEETRKHLYKQS